MNLWEMVIKGRLRKDISILENQFGFMPEWSTTKAINLIKRHGELYRYRKKDLHIVFRDLGKAYSKVPGEVLKECLEKKMCRWRTSELLRICTREWKLVLGTQQTTQSIFLLALGSIRFSFKLVFFTIIMDKFMIDIQDKVPLYMLFADDIVFLMKLEMNLTVSWRNGGTPWKLGDLDLAGQRLNT